MLLIAHAYLWVQFVHTLVKEKSAGPVKQWGR